MTLPFTEIPECMLEFIRQERLQQCDFTPRTRLCLLTILSTAVAKILYHHRLLRDNIMMKAIIVNTWVSGLIGLSIEGLKNCKWK